MQVGAEEPLIEAVIGQLSDLGFDVHRSSGVNQTVLGAIGVQPDFDTRRVHVMEGVAEVYRVTEPYKFASRTWRQGNTEFEVGGIPIGGEEIALVSGPNMVESEEQLEQVAAFIAKQGGRFLRADIHRPRPSPYTFSGHGMKSLELLRRVADLHNLRVVSKVSSSEMVDAMANHIDIFHISSHHMQNFELLQAVGKSGKPVILKRGLSATIEEWLMSAEYILVEGNTHVILCEGGIRTFEKYTRNTLDLSSIPVIKERSHLPIIVDPSHGTGFRNKVIPMARAAIAAGADGLMIETHPDPLRALSEGPQALYFDEFVELLQQVQLIAVAIGRKFAMKPDKAVRS